ncbi:MAG: trigger factor [Chloroflexota bacterium]|nr:trigger factor [Chloroflexota bacterium]
MKLNVERKPASLVVFDITADDDEFAEAMTRAVRKVSRDIQLPGFRKGKAPRSMVERTYGREVFLQEAADDVMERLYRDALKQEDVTPVGEPSVEIIQLEPVNFVVTIPVYPAIDAGDYASVRVDPVDAAVEDAEIDEVLERLRNAQSPWVDLKEARKPAANDQVTIDYEVMDGGTPFQDPVTDATFVLGETNLLTQLSAKIEEMNAGDTETFELVFDEDDETADPSIRGKSLTYSVTLKSVKERDLLPLDDEFAKTVAEAESLEDLRNQVREDIHTSKTSDGRTNVLNRIIEEMAGRATIDPPEAMIDEETEHQLNHFKENLARSNTPYEAYLRIQGKTEDDIKADLRPEAARRLRNSLLIQELAKRENIEVTDEDIEPEITRMVELVTTPPTDADLAGAEADLGELDEEERAALAEADAELDEVPPLTAEQAEAQVAQMRQMYESDYFKNMLRSQLFERKLTDRLIEIATDGKGAVLNAWEAPSESADDASLAETSVADDPGAEPIAPGAVADADAISDDEGSGADAPEAGAANATSGNLPAEGEGTDWVAGDGTNDIPDGFTIKGNASSHIYHPEASSSYDNTIAEIYFSSPEAAERAGYRMPKNLEKAGEAAATTAGDISDGE